jgi:PAS domain S-box-containing protein
MSRLTSPRAISNGLNEPEISLPALLEELLCMRLELKEARQQEAWLRMVLDTCNDAFVSSNVMGQILQWNCQAEQLFGWTHEEAVGRQLSDTIFPVNEMRRGTRGLQDLLELDPAGERIETMAHTRAGKQLPVEVSISPMRTGGSFVLNAFIHDISSRRAMQTKLNHASRMESVGQLSAGIAHEINTPTQYVGDNTRFLQDSFADILQVLDIYQKLTVSLENNADVADALAKVQAVVEEKELDYLRTEICRAIEESLQGVERVAAIVRAMKEFSHPGTHEKTFSDINKGIQNTITVATNEWKYVAAVETDLDSSLPLVSCLPGDLNQVILNLIVNAAHAIADVIGKSPTEKGKICISTRQHGDSVEIRVSDTGTGIPEDIRSRIFDPFFTTKDIGVGSGQGLAIARSVIVDKHGGTLELESEVSQGTTFVIRLPIGNPMHKQRS